MVTTDDDQLWSKMWSYKDHGKSWGAVYERKHRPGFQWLHDNFGTNLRMLELKGDIDNIQLQKPENCVAEHTEIAAHIQKMLEPLASAVYCPEATEHIIHSHYHQYANLRPQCLRDGWNRDRIVAEANSRNLALFQGRCSEVCLEQAFYRTDLRPQTQTQTQTQLLIARELSATRLMFLTHPTITVVQLEGFVRIMSDIITAASR
jgi:dTDP-4-amino-4,6-dideoxygalactose transaminase